MGRYGIMAELTDIHRITAVNIPSGAAEFPAAFSILDMELWHKRFAPRPAAA
jgi:hypothetical protein